MSVSSIISKAKVALTEGMIMLTLATVISLALSKGVVVMTHNSVEEGKRIAELSALIGDANDYLGQMESQSIIF